MHDSMKRLLDLARERTRHLGDGQRVETFTDLGNRLNVSSAVMTNWKARGISKEGALDAQRMWGINALWLLERRAPATIDGGGLLTAEVTTRLVQLEANELRRAENQLRAYLDMPPLLHVEFGKRDGTHG